MKRLMRLSMVMLFATMSLTLVQKCAGNGRKGLLERLGEWTEERMEEYQRAQARKVQEKIDEIEDKIKEYARERSKRLLKADEFKKRGLYEEAEGAKAEALRYKMQMQAALKHLVKFMERSHEEAGMGGRILEHALKRATDVEAARMKAEAERETILAKTAVEAEIGLKKVKHIVKGLTQPQTLAIGTAAIISIVGAKYLFDILKRKAEAVLFVPKLITKSSIGMFGIRKKRPPSRMHMFVGSPEIKEQVEIIIDRVKRAKEQNTEFTNVVFYGKPGTGKTMMAEEIATQSGTDYAMFSAGDFGKLSREEMLKQLEKILDWAEALKKQGKQLIVFIDEADYFLLDRRIIMKTDPETGPARIAAQTMFLNRVPSARNKGLMFIFASNFYKNFDIAVLDRIGDPINFPLPEAPERRKLLQVYLNSFQYTQGIL